MYSAGKMRLLDPVEWAEIGLRAGNLNAAEGWLARRMDALGIENAGLAIDISRSAPAVPAQERMIGSLVSPEWHEYYRQNEHLLRHDAVARHIFASETPAFILLPDHPPTFAIREPEEYALLRLVHDFGMRGTLAFSCFDRRGGTMSVFVGVTYFANAEFVHSGLEHANRIQLAFEYLIEGLRMRARGPDSLAALLSPRERECLLWASIGKTTKEIADRLSLADHTVNAYLSSAMRKLGCSTRTQACIRAILLERIAG